MFYLQQEPIHGLHSNFPHVIKIRQRPLSTYRGEKLRFDGKRRWGSLIIPTTLTENKFASNEVIPHPSYVGNEAFCFGEAKMPTDLEDVSIQLCNTVYYANRVKAGRIPAPWQYTSAAASRGWAGTLFGETALDIQTSPTGTC